MYFQIKDDKEILKIHNSGLGFIYNDYSGKSQSKNNDNVLHASHCDDVTRSNIKKKKFYFSRKSDALNWLEKKRGEEGVRWRCCGNCDALGQDDVEEINSNILKIGNVTLKAQENLSKIDDVFKESKVQAILVNYLKTQNYNVKESHRVVNGLIDIVAEKDDEMIVIEVKGEDKGGYGSVEMNFQIGVEQILSRMTNKNVKYALAFPLTGNFKKVLKKYKKTSGFQNLNLFFYITKEDETIECHTCESLIMMIDNL